VPAALWQLSATELAARLRAGELTATEVLGSFLERIAEVNPRINAIVSLDEESARAQAASLDRLGPQEGHVLHGLPIAIKDLEDTAGLRTTYGSPLYADHYPAADSLMVSRLRAAGANIIGKTNTPEWGAGSQTFNPVFGATRNPWDLARTPGGSSGGAAAAVASGMLPFADGSDFGGSIRNPASLCGLVGLRPSPGRVPDPSGDPYNPLPVLGPIARTAADAALLLSAIAGPDPRVPMSGAWPPLMGGDPGQTPGPAGVKVAWCPDLGDLPVAPEVTATLAHGRAALQRIGCDVQDVAVTLPGADEAFEVLRGVGFAARFGPLLRRHRDQLKDTIVQNAEYGLALTGGQVGEAIDARVATAQRMRRLLEDHDVVALTSVQVAAFDVETEWPTEIDGHPMGSYLEWMRSCSRITVTGHPSISVPAGMTAGGLPVGMQLVGPEGDEPGLLRLAAALDRVTGYSDRRPPL
jgi:amidase